MNTQPLTWNPDTALTDSMRAWIADNLGQDSADALTDAGVARIISREYPGGAAEFGRRFHADQLTAR